MSNILRQSAIGVKFDITIKENGVVVDLSSVSQKNLIFLRPDGSRLVKATSFINTGTDGQLRYTSIAGDLDLLGPHELQIDLIFPAGYDGPTDIGSFWVEANL